jgi:3'-phosphoadenosine 5'-phosphosulfate (PAPS) 3'-phosphatase
MTFSYLWRMQDELSFMHEVADEAGALAMHFLTTGTAVQQKPDQSPVTEADLEWRADD